MFSDKISLNLARNVKHLQEKINKTEKSIDKLEHVNRRLECSTDALNMDANIQDETCSLPPPLTLEELMVESSLYSSCSSIYSKDIPLSHLSRNSSYRKARSSLEKREDTPIPFTEYTIENTQSVIDNRTAHEQKTGNFDELSEYTLIGNISGTAKSPKLTENAKHSFLPLSEYTMGSGSTNSFHMLQPEITFNSVQMTSSPRKMYHHNGLFDPSKLIQEKKKPNNLEKNNSGNLKLKSNISCIERSCQDTSNVSNNATSIPQISGMIADDDPNETFSSQLAYEPNTTKSSDGVIFDTSLQRPISSRSNATSITLTSSDNKDIDQLKQKLVVVRSENARLRTLVSQLRDQIEKQLQLVKFPNAINIKEEQLSELIVGLQDQIKANERTLRNTEDELDYKDKLSAEKDKVINALKIKLVNFQKLLQETKTQKLSAESARDQASREVNLLTLKLKEYYNLMTSKLGESQEIARKEVAKVISEHDSLSRKLNLLQLENESLVTKQRELQKKIRILENESRDQDADAAKMMDQAQQRIRELVAELDQKHLSLKKSNIELSQVLEKKKELEEDCIDMKEQNSMQRERLHCCQQENELIKSELEEVKKKLAQLKRSQVELVTVSYNNATGLSPEANQATKHLQISPRKHHSTVSELNMQIATKEAHIKRLEARLVSQASETGKLENLAEELMTVGEKARASERRANELEDVVHLMESERTKYLRKVNDLQDEVHDKVSENESLENRLKERTSLLNQCQKEVDELKIKAAKLESEMKQKKEELSSLQNTLKEKENDEQLIRSKLADVQSELLSKSRSLDNATERSGKQEILYRRELKRVKKLHTEQCEELTEQLEMVQKECTKHKTQASLTKEQVMMMNEQRAIDNDRMLQLEGELEMIRKEERCRTESHEQALKILEEKLSSSTATIHSLEDALAQCKTDLSVYIDKLNEKHSEFQHQMALKTDQVSKLETDLKLAQNSLHDECSRTLELESALEGRQKMLEDAAARIAELEESQATLQTQVSKKEKQLSSENGKANLLIHEMEEKLELACRELDSKKRQYTELNGALKKVDEDFRECKKELAIVEDQLEELKNDHETQKHELEQSRFEWKEMKTDVDSKIERIAELESENQKISRNEKKLQEKILELETDITNLQAQNEDARHHNDELKSYSQNRNADILNKEIAINQLQEALKKSKLEYENEKLTSEELKKSLDERQWQLQQRATQLTKLDMQVREFRSGIEKRNIQLENELEKTQDQLKERNSQVSHLDEQISAMRLDIAEVRRLLSDEQMNVKRLERELLQKEDRVEELLKTLENERKSREERHQACIESSQEVRITREREQKLGRSYQDSQREVSRLHREQQQLLNDIHELSEANREKDDRVDRLMSQLSSLTSEKVSIESKYRDELDRMQSDALKLKQQCEDENENLISVNAQLRAQLKIASGNQAEELASALQREKEAVEETKRIKESLYTLERELEARKQVIEAGNDTIIIKDAEIARLQARLSGFERVTIMASLPNTPVKPNLSVGNKSDLRNLSATSNKQVTPTANVGIDFISKKPWTINDVTATSLFTGIESDVGSVAPSFVPIAASTKRRCDADQKEDSSYFFTSSPNQVEQQLSALSTEEESLYKRVFGDLPLDDCSTNFLTQVVIGKKKVDRSTPERCMSELQQKLHASEQRRKEVATKLRNLKVVHH